MHHGKIVEQGKHDILLNQKGMYAQMYEEQMKQHQE
jgi:ABC-type multidrug transport system fused ATPase/permease subunit